ncbi:MAG: hypothetical protein QGG40_07615, partial [Myxococcota bacterium]|nr:hypothetical protein [Myxococcota bacterium]
MTAWLRQFYIDAGLDRVEGEQRSLVWLGDGLFLLWALVREVRRDRLTVRASTLAFWTTVAIVPILLLAFALTGPLGLVDDTR